MMSAVATLALSLGCAHATDPGAPITSADLTTPVKDFPIGLGANADRNQQVNYAWRLFIAAMQQTTATQINGSGRGYGNGVDNFIDTGKTPSAAHPLVFESLYHRTEAFPYYTTESNPYPSPIGKSPTYYTYYEKEDLRGKKSTVPLTVKNAHYVYLDENNQIGQNYLYYRNSNAPEFPVLYMAKVNELETQYALGLLEGKSPGFKPNPKKSWDFPNGVVEIKAAWRRVKDIKHSDPNSYHQAMATYYTSPGKDRAPVQHHEPFALIALHIIQKSENYPQFIFSTFEHVDAVTRKSSGAIVDPAFQTAYNQISYQTTKHGGSMEPSATPLGAYNVNASGQSPVSNGVHMHSLPHSGVFPSTKQNPGCNAQNGLPKLPDQKCYVTVEQPYTITAEVNDINNSVNRMVKDLSPDNVWANYRLKGVQAIPTSDQKAPDYYLGNIAVESSQPGIQLFTGVLLNGGVGQKGKTSETKENSYFVNCRGQKDMSECIYPSDTGLDGGKIITYNNVTLGVTQGSPVATPSMQVGGCQGCHGAAQQLGRDFSFLANGYGGSGKELDATPAANLGINIRDAINREMAADGNVHN